MCMKTVLITGASRGIGASIALEFAKNNYNVVISYNSSKCEGEKVKEYIEKNYKVKCLMVKCDISSEIEVSHMVDLSLKEFGNIDVLINNASVSMDNDIMSKSKDEFLRVVEVNLVGTFLVTREVIKKCNVNTIVNISSTDSTSTYSKLNIDYSCSKAGVNILSKTFSLCYPDIKICTIMPNWVNSETVLSMNSDYLEEEMKRIGQKKLIDKEYVARKTYEVVVDKFIKNGDIIRIDEGEV
jgi:3-oxoacyl-[acyl-carrier protein] reductase